MAGAWYYRLGSMLRISGSLGPPYEARFETEVKGLLEFAAANGLRKVLVDLRGLRTIDVRYVGRLSQAASEMAKRDGVLVIRAHGRICDCMRRSGMPEAVPLEAQ